MDSRAKELVQIGSRLFSQKLQWDQLAQEIAEQIYPLRADFTTKFTLGDDFSVDLMDSFPVLARDTLGSMPNAMLRQGEWFKGRTGDEELDELPQVERWFERTTQTLYRLIYDRRANFRRATIEADHDYVAFGNPVLTVEESPTRDHMLFRSWHPKEVAFMENAVGAIDHVQRNAPMTARAIVKRRTWKNIHSDIKQAAEKDPTKEFKVRHIVLPTDEVYGDDRKAMRRYKDMPFLSIYVDCEHEEILGEGGLPVFNYVIPRARTISGYQYGFSPWAINALPEARMLQQLSRIILEKGEKAVDPPTIGKGEIFRDAINLYAGGHTFVDMENDDDIRKVFQTVETGDISIGAEMKADTRNLISEAFLLNKLMLPNVREMTATEASFRMDEFRRAALPFFGPIEAEYHLPLLDTAFQIALRNGAFNIEEMPDELQDREVTFSFESPLNTAEGRQAVQSFMESVQIIAAASQFDQSIPQRWNLPKMVDDAVRGTGAPTDWEVDEEQRVADEAQAKQVAGLQQAAQMLQGGAAVGKDVADATIALQQAGLA